MKTTKTKRADLPRPLRVIIFVFAIATLCLPNWIILNAGDPLAHRSDFESRFKDVLAVQPEQEIGLEKWMLCNEAWCKDGIAEIQEPEIQVEDWMLNIGNSHQFAAADPEIQLEEWMLDFAIWPHAAHEPIMAENAEK